MNVQRVVHRNLQHAVVVADRHDLIMSGQLRRNPLDHLGRDIQFGNSHVRNAQLLGQRLHQLLLIDHLQFQQDLAYTLIALASLGGGDFHLIGRYQTHIDQHFSQPHSSAPSANDELLRIVPMCMNNTKIDSLEHSC